MTPVRKSRDEEGGVLGLIKQAESGIAIEDRCRRGGFSDATFKK
jgi:putative transposase